MFKTLLYRPVWLPVVITVSLLIFSLLLMNSTARSGLERLHPIQIHLKGFTDVQTVLLHVQKTLLNHIGEGSDISVQDLANIRHKIGEVVATYKDENTAVAGVALQQAYDALGEQNVMPIPALMQVLNQLNIVVKSETDAHNELIAEARIAAREEVEIATTTLIILPLLGVALLFFVRKRILSPLNELGWLMSQLARRDYAPAPSHNVDPLLKSLIGDYNAMVGRMAELEQQHVTRHATLESLIHAAAGHLLDQQRTLANAQRLAAVGELAAQLAHELRNPLAGIQMALLNLREEINNPDQIERIELVRCELVRITTLLNSLLDQSRHHPELPTKVVLAYVTDEIFTLARYQLPERITLRHEIAADLRWSLPENELRRTLLNLILNSHQAIGEATGTIHISAQQQHDHLLLEVCDDGPGFPESLLTTGIRIFKTTRPEGTGLGLVAVQRFVNELQGRLQLRNIAPHGACVTLLIPAPGITHD